MTAGRSETLVPVAVASELTGASIDEIQQWLADASVRAEWVGRHVYVCLEDVELAVQAARKGSLP